MGRLRAGAARRSALDNPQSPRRASDAAGIRPRCRSRALPPHSDRHRRRLPAEKQACAGSALERRYCCHCDATRHRDAPPSVDLVVVCRTACAPLQPYHAPRTAHRAPRTTHHASRTKHHAPSTTPALLLCALRTEERSRASTPRLPSPPVARQCAGACRPQPAVHSGPLPLHSGHRPHPRPPLTPARSPQASSANPAPRTAPPRPATLDVAT